MVQETRRGLQNLARYVEAVEGDPEKAVRIRQRLEEINAFFEQEGLSEINNPRKLIDEARSAREETRYVHYQNHLAAVAQEALRVEAGEFVHDTQAGVVRSLRERMRGGDPKLIPDYTDSTLKRQIIDSHKIGYLMLVGQGPAGDRYARMPLVDLVVSEEFTTRFRYEGWLETLRYASEVLPSDTDSFDLLFLLLSYSKSVGPDLTKFKSVEARVGEVRRGFRRNAA